METNSIALWLGIATACAPCAFSDFARSWYQIGHIVNRTPHGRYLSKRYAAKLGSAASRSATVSLRAR